VLEILANQWVCDDRSSQNAYNLGIQISLTSIAGGTTPSGLTCTSPSCTISNLNSFCQSPNTLTGAPGEGCYNTDGPGDVPTSGTEAFASACPQAYSYSKDDANHVYGCPTTSNYKVTWCPWFHELGMTLNPKPWEEGEALHLGLLPSKGGVWIYLCIHLYVTCGNRHGNNMWSLTTMR